MADGNNVYGQQGGEAMESTDRGLFDFMKKKEEADHHDDQKKKPDDHQEEVIATEFDHKVHVSDPEGCKKDEVEEKKHGGVGSLLEKLHRSDSSSSSSSDEEEGDDEEKKKRKKEKKEKKGLKEKFAGHKDEEEKKHDHDHEEDTNVPIEKCHDEEKSHFHSHSHPHVEEVVYSEPSHPLPQAQVEEKKGLLDKIKEKLPGQQKKPDEHDVGPVAPVVVEPHTEGESKEKKGFLDKIKEKIPGFHSKNDEEEKKEEKRVCE